MALAEYRAKFWFPSGALALNVPARVFLYDDNVLADLFTDGTGTTPLPNPLTTSDEGQLAFWAEQGSYWVHIDTDSFHIILGDPSDPATKSYVNAKITVHNQTHQGVHDIPDTHLLETQTGAQTKADAAKQAAVETAAKELDAHTAATKNVHGITDTAALLTQAEVDGLAKQADLDAHTAATKNVHGITDTAALETKTGAQAKADTARDQAVATASTDATAKANTARDEAEETAAAALTGHAAQTTDVHGITDTAELLTQADVEGLATEEELHAVQAEVSGVQGALAAHAAQTTNVHGIPNTEDIPTGDELRNLSNELDAHAQATTDVHGISSTMELETQTGAQIKATTAKNEAVKIASADAATQANAARTQAEQTAALALARHAAQSTNVHGIVDAGALETQSGAQAKADAARDAAIADAAGKYLNAETGGEVAGDMAVAGTLRAHGVLDWFNVRQYGATGDGATDDTAAVQSALDACPPGGVVYLPTGDYRTSAPLIVRSAVTLFMAHSDLGAAPGQDQAPCLIRVLPGFTGTCAIQIGEEAKITAEQRLVNVMVDGSAVPDAFHINGISAAGQAENVILQDVTVSGFGYGLFITDSSKMYPRGWHLTRVTCENCETHGMFFRNVSHLSLVECRAVNNDATGFEFLNTPYGRLSGCRAEGNAQHGFNFTGDWRKDLGGGAGGMLVADCATDANGASGMYVNTLGEAPMTFNNLMLHGDATSAYGPDAAFHVELAQSPIIVSGLMVWPGVNDEGDPCPLKGLSVWNNAPYCSFDNAFIHAAEQPVFTMGSNTVLHFGPTVATATGPADAPVISPVQDWNWAGVARAVQTAPEAHILEGALSAKGAPLFALRADGTLIHGDGSAAPDTAGWSRGAAGVLTSGAGVAVPSLAIVEGTPDARMGEATLSGGTGSVANTAVTDTCRIFLSRQSAGSAPGHLSYTRSAGIGFTITSSSSGDDGVVEWLMVEAAQSAPGSSAE